MMDKELGLSGVTFSGLKLVLYGYCEFDIFHVSAQLLRDQPLCWSLPMQGLSEKAHVRTFRENTHMKDNMYVPCDIRCHAMMGQLWSGMTLL